MPPGKTTFTLAEAADLLSCHRETLRRAIRSGELRAAKLGRGFRISRFDLEAFWTTSGGGDLFGKEQDGSPEGEAAQPAPKTRRKKNRQLQLSLPVSNGTRQETPDKNSRATNGGVVGGDKNDAGKQEER